MKLSDSNIIWEGECDSDHCVRGKIPVYRQGFIDCPDCNGTGVYSRPATLDEWNEISMKAFKDVYSLQKQAGVQGFEVNKKYRINNGTLKIKED